MRKVCRMHRTYIFSSRFDWNASRWMIRKGRHTRPTRSALAYNGEFFPITNAPCLRCIVENASPFSIVFSQLETEWLTIPISFVSFFSFPPSSFRFLCLLFFFLYYTRGRFYFILFYFFFFFKEYVTIFRDTSRISWSFRNLKLEWEDQWFSLKSRFLYRFLSMLINRLRLGISDYLELILMILIVLTSGDA